MGYSESAVRIRVRIRFSAWIHYIPWDEVPTEGKFSPARCISFKVIFVANDLTSW